MLNRQYNSFLYQLFNLSYIYDVKRDPTVCKRILTYIKQYQPLFREYNCSVLMYNDKSYIIPPFNKELVLTTDHGKVKFTALSKNGMDLTAFRLAEPLLCIPSNWGMYKVCEQLQQRN